MKGIPQRQDIPPDGQAPKAVQRFLLNLGGWNPYGEPMLRLVLADKILIHRGGVWHDWPEWAKLEDMGGLEFSDEKEIIENVEMNGPDGHKIVVDIEQPKEIRLKEVHPVRVVSEMRWVQRYPNKRGWMLQMWEPASRYGSRQWWEAQRVPGASDLMILGPFPERGEYEPCFDWIDVDVQGTPYSCSSWPEIPALSKIEYGFTFMMQHREKAQSANPEWRKLTRMIEWKNQEIAKETKIREEKLARMRDHLSAMTSTSLAAGRVREGWANEARKKGVDISHVGN